MTTEEAAKRMGFHSPRNVSLLITNEVIIATKVPFRGRTGYRYDISEAEVQRYIDHEWEIRLPHLPPERLEEAKKRIIFPNMKRRQQKV